MSRPLRNPREDDASTPEHALAMVGAFMSPAIGRLLMAQERLREAGNTDVYLSAYVYEAIQCATRALQSTEEARRLMYPQLGLEHEPAEVERLAPALAAIKVATSRGRR